MKKTYLALIGVIAFGVMFMTAFKEGEMTPEQKEQMDKIESTVNGMLDSFRLVKDKECMDRAFQVAVVRADSVMTALKNAKPVAGKPKKPVKKDPVPTTPKTVEPPVQTGNVGKKTDDAAKEGENVGKKTDDAAKEGRNVGKKKTGDNR